MKTTETKEVFVVWQNTDLTEGRGWNLPISICESETTAKRIGKGKDVMGCDCEITRSIAYKVEGQWYGPVHIYVPEESDKKADEIEAKRRTAIEKAKTLGLTKEEVEDLYRGLC